MQKSPKHELEGVMLGGKWMIKGLIGTGGVGDVFEAENTQLRRTAAVKIVRVASQQAAERLERGTRTSAMSTTWGGSRMAALTSSSNASTARRSPA